jgi:hypothetical protein
VLHLAPLYAPNFLDSPQPRLLPFVWLMPPILAEQIIETLDSFSFDDVTSEVHDYAGIRCLPTRCSSVGMPTAVAVLSQCVTRGSCTTYRIVREKKIWSWVSWDLEPRMTVLVRANNNLHDRSVINFPELINCRYTIDRKFKFTQQPFYYLIFKQCGGLSWWPRGLGHELSSLARTLGSWVRIPLKAWMSVYAFILCVGSGLATGWFPVQGVIPCV